MKIYFNRRPVKGPWGGGSKVLSSVVEECHKRNHTVIFEEQLDLTNGDVDLIVCLDPRPNQSVDFKKMLEYKEKFGKKILQRVGDLGTHGKPELFELLKKTTPLVDVLVFPSNWAKKYLNQDDSIQQYVIKNAPLPAFVFSKNYEKSFDEKINLVTHHWSDNVNKGFDFYQELDNYCLNSKKFTFTYIGRAPRNISFNRHLPPHDVSGLIDELPNYHIYVTASKLEAGANHVLEALALNLPVLYHSDGGSIHEYCKDHGFSYTNLEELTYILENHIEHIYSIFIKMSVTRQSLDMAKEYVNLFETIA